MFCVLCLDIWWCHDIWISEKLKFDYLINEKSFWSTKKCFPCFTKPTSRNVAGTTFKCLLNHHDLIKPPNYYMVESKFSTETLIIKVCSIPSNWKDVNKHMLMLIIIYLKAIKFQSIYQLIYHITSHQNTRSVLNQKLLLIHSNRLNF